jgi:hypothetical protein
MRRPLFMYATPQVRKDRPQAHPPHASAPRTNTPLVPNFAATTTVDTTGTMRLVRLGPAVEGGYLLR